MELDLELSLDDYIKKSNGLNHAKPTNSQPSDGGWRKRNSINDDNDDDDDDDDVIMINTNEALDTTLWRGPSSDISKLPLDGNDQIKQNDDQLNQNNNNPKVNNTQRFDLRNKLHQPNLKSQDWRMLNPNVNLSRPPGMPPLVPQNAPFRRNQHNQNHSNRNFNKKYNNNRQNNGVRQFNCGKRNFDRRDQQKFKNSLQRMNSSNGSCTVFNLTIPRKNVPQRNLINNMGPLGNSFGSLSNLSTMSNFGPNMANTGQCHATQSLQDVVGLDGRDINMMPQIASKLLDMIKSGITSTTTHKPIYDMQVHKEISEIQHKPFIYKCGGEQVVSSDGPGINNCAVTPVSTTMSLNYRFA